MVAEATPPEAADDRYAQHLRDQEAAQRLVDRAIPPMPYHPFLLGFAVYGIAEIALRLSGVDGRVSAVPFIMGVVVWAAGSLWERIRDRRLEQEIGRLSEVADPSL